jgi:cell division protein ZapA
MSAEKSSVTVRIAGEEHTIRANVEPEHTRRCARLVDERIQEIRAKGGLIEGHRAAILAALSIADQLFQAEAEVEGMRSRVRTRSAELTRRLEAALEPGDPPPAE